MPGRRVFDLIEIPDEFWQRAEVLDALRRRDIGRLFVLLYRRHGRQPDPPGHRVRHEPAQGQRLHAGGQQVEELDVFERIADGLDDARPGPHRPRPGPARRAAHAARLASQSSRHGIPARPCLRPAVSDLLSLRSRRQARRMMPPCDAEPLSA